MAKATKNPSVGSDRQAKIQAAAKASGGGVNKIIVAAAIAILAIVGVVGFVVFKQVAAQNAIKGDGKAVPAGATASGPYAPFTDVTAKPGAPTVEIYEDFQCPACGQFEALHGAAIEEMAKAGDIVLKYHILNFLDGKLGNDGSVKAANGAFCAADAGKFQQFHDLAYKNQPTEGAGWTTDGLKGLATQAGITGAELDTWTKCVDLGKYTTYVKSVDEQAFGKDGITGTPTVKVNGKLVANKDIKTPEAFKALIAAKTTK